MRNVRVSKAGVSRYSIHLGNTKVEAEAEYIGRLLLDQLDQALMESDGYVTFEFIGAIPDRDLATVVMELDGIRKSKLALQAAYESKVPTRDLREAYDRWCTQAYTQSLPKLYRALGFDPGDLEEQRRAS